MRGRIGDSIVIVIYDEVIGQGSNGLFRCVGFLRATLTEVRLTGHNEHISCRVEEIGILHDLISGGNHPSPNLLKVQLIK